jgi:hypothetical protein
MQESFTLIQVPLEYFLPYFLQKIVKLTGK